MALQFLNSSHLSHKSPDLVEGTTVLVVQVPNLEGKVLSFVQRSFICPIEGNSAPIFRSVPYCAH